MCCLLTLIKLLVVLQVLLEFWPLWTSITQQQRDDTPNLLAKEELNLLARLMGSMKSENTPSAETGFRINLFTTDKEEDEA